VDPIPPNVGTVAKARMHEEAVAAHRVWLLARPEEVMRARRELRGCQLGCFCAPRYECHGDNLAEVANCSPAWLCQEIDEAGQREVWTRWAEAAGGAAAGAAVEREVRMALAGARNGGEGTDANAAATAAAATVEEVAVARAVAAMTEVRGAAQSALAEVIAGMALEVSSVVMRHRQVEAAAEEATRATMAALGYDVAGTVTVHPTPYVRAPKRVRFAAALVSEVRTIPRMRMYQAASTRGTAYALHRWHVTCVDQRLAGHVHQSDTRVFQQLVFVVVGGTGGAWRDRR